MKFVSLQGYFLLIFVSLQGYILRIFVSLQGYILRISLKITIIKYSLVAMVLTHTMPVCFVVGF